MKKIWEDDFNNLYRDVEDMQNHCKYLESENKKLQSNWNSLREWLEEYLENEKYCYLAENVKDRCRYDVFNEVLDKMNELEGDNNGIMD